MEEKSMMKNQEQEGTKPSQPVLVPGAVIEIPVEGALGLLALGARGLMAWRQKRDEVLMQDEVLKQQKEQVSDE